MKNLLVLLLILGSILSGWNSLDPSSVAKNPGCDPELHDCSTEDVAT